MGRFYPNRDFGGDAGWSVRSTTGSIQDYWRGTTCKTRWPAVARRPIDGVSGTVTRRSTGCLRALIRLLLNDCG